MNIVLLESLGVPEEVLNACAKPLVDAGHTFKAYPKDADPKVQIERAKDADVIMIANMPLSGEVISACPNLKYIDVAFTGVDHVDLDAARAKGVKVSNAAGYSNEAVAELTLCMMLALLRNMPQVEARCRAGQTKDGLVGVELMGKTVGIVGVGAIGTPYRRTLPCLWMQGPWKQAPCPRGRTGLHRVCIPGGAALPVGYRFAALSSQ